MRPRFQLLLVEDNPGDAELAQERLSDIDDFGFDLNLVTTLKAATRTIQESRIDVTILDLNLPDSTGLDTLRSLRRVRDDIPIVVLSGSYTHDLRHEAFLEGAQDFISKNEPMARLLARSVRYAFERHCFMEQQQQIQRLVSANPDAVIVTALNGEVKYANKAAEIFFGKSQNELIGESLLIDVNVDELQEFEFMRASEKRIADVHKVQIEWMKQPAYLATLRDITEQKRLDAQLQQAQKMEAVGRLAGGLAHDFNNLLTVINGCADMLLSPPPDDPDQCQMLEEIRIAGDRAAALTKQLLAFSRKSVAHPSPLKLNGVIENFKRMLGRLIGEDIELSSRLAPDVWPVLADTIQIEQVLFNLAINSRDAMPRGGRLDIETRNVHLDEPYAESNVEMLPGHYVLLTVSDNGSGMSEETKRHLFEPFFTTKEVGKGTGLGMAMVYGIIKQMGGHIHVYSELGSGTAIKLYLPRYVESGEEVAAKPETAKSAYRGIETILLVEDDAGVRRVCKLILESAGYTVIEAENGMQALQLARDNSETIDLILSDVIMPQMSGKELMEEMSKIKPDIKCLFMSGYTGDAILNYGILQSIPYFIQKPFTPAQLTQKIRQIFDDMSQDSGAN